MIRSVLLSGGAGYIGSHTARLLAQSGFRPVVLDNLCTGNSWAVKWGPFVQGDIRDYDLALDTLRTYRIAAVIHFAASAYVGDSMKAPKEYFDNNVVASLDFLRAVIDAGVRSVVFSSSCATYGHPETARIAESHPQCPVNPYGETKLMIERALRWYDKAYDLRSVCLRYFNAAGADPDGEIGESHDPETHLIPLAIHTALGLRASLDVFGSDYDTPDGSAIRDFIHVSDLAAAHLRALHYLLEGNSSQSFNLGKGTGYSVRDVIEAVERASGHPLPVQFKPRRAGDPAFLVADASRAHDVLGWSARRSDLQTVVRHAWAWHSRFGSLSGSTREVLTTAKGAH